MFLWISYTYHEVQFLLTSLLLFPELHDIELQRNGIGVILDFFDTCAQTSEKVDTGKVIRLNQVPILPMLPRRRTDYKNKFFDFREPCSNLFNHCLLYLNPLLMYKRERCERRLMASFLMELTREAIWMEVTQSGISSDKKTTPTLKLTLIVHSLPIPFYR